MSGSRRLAVLTVLFAASLFACSAVFGIKDVTLEDAADASGSDGAFDDGASPPVDGAADMDARDSTLDSASAVDASDAGSLLDASDASDARGSSDASDGSIVGVRCAGDAGADGGACEFSPRDSVLQTNLPLRLAANATTLFALTQLYSPGNPLGGIVSCPLAGCATLTPVTPIGQPTDMAVDANFVYWASATDRVVARCNPSACSTTTTVLASSQDATRLAVVSGNVYWINQPMPGGDGQIFKCAVGGCGMAPTAVTNAVHDPSSFALTGTGLYWLARNNGTGGQLVSCPPGGCGASSGMTLLAGLNEAEELAVDDTSAYWAKQIYGSARIDGCKLDGSGCTTLFAAASGNNNVPSRIALTANDVYFTQHDLTGAGSLVSCPRSATGCGSTLLFMRTIAANQRSAANLLLVGTQLFWTVDGPAGLPSPYGVIMTAPLPP